MLCAAVRTAGGNSWEFPVDDVWTVGDDPGTTAAVWTPDPVVPPPSTAAVPVPDRRGLGEHRSSTECTTAKKTMKEIF
jgi:hypothetical protein